MASFDANELGRVVPIVVASFLNSRPSASQPVGEVSTINTSQSSGNSVQQNTGVLSYLRVELGINNLHKLHLVLRKLQALASLRSKM